MGRRKIYDDRYKYIYEWTSMKCDRIYLKIPKGEKAIIHGFAKSQGISATSFIRECVRLRTEQIYNEADDETKKVIDDTINKYIEEEREREIEKEKRKEEQSHSG